MEELYKKNAKIVYCYLRSLCHDSQIAEELTQETFFQAMKSIERYDGSCKVSTWLCQIAKHVYYKYLQKRKNEILSDMNEEAYPRSLEKESAEGFFLSGRNQAEQGKALQSVEKQNPERQVLAKIELMEVLKEMQTLPQAMREVMYLRITAELSFKEIAEIMGKSENWARVNFFRGKEILVKRRNLDEKSE